MWSKSNLTNKPSVKDLRPAASNRQSVRESHAAISTKPSVRELHPGVSNKPSVSESHPAPLTAQSSWWSFRRSTVSTAPLAKEPYRESTESEAEPAPPEEPIAPEPVAPRREVSKWLIPYITASFWHLFLTTEMRENNLGIFKKSILYILATEVCERFNYYAVRELIIGFLINSINFRQKNARRIYDMFIILCYLFPLVGAHYADNYFSKYTTVVAFSVIYLLSSICLSGVASIAAPVPEMLLLLMGFACGGIKPCIAALGGDQFQQPVEKAELESFFFWFYMAINFASVVAIILTKVLDEILVFWLATMMMGTALVVFIVGKPTYKIFKPTQHITRNAISCIHYALAKRLKTKRKKTHWLDHASPKFDDLLIEDIKVALSVLLLFIPMPFFWTIYLQQFDDWKKVQMKMNRFYNNELIKTEFWDVVNPVCVLVFIPLFKYGIYPLFGMVHLLRKPLQRIIAGGILAGLALVVAALIALQTEKASSPDKQRFIIRGDGRTLIYNNMECDASGTIYMKDRSKTYIITKYTFLDLQNLPIPPRKRHHTYSMAVNNSCYGYMSTDIWVYKKELSVCVLQRKVSQFYGKLERDEDGYPQLMIAINGPKTRNAYVNFYYKDALKLNVTQNTSEVEIHTLPFPNLYDIIVDDVYVRPARFNVRSIYAVFVNVNDNQPKITIHELASNDRISFWWLLPQHIILAAAEVMFAISAIEFSYTQAPDNMKCLMQAFWLVSIALGRLIKPIFETLFENDKMSSHFLTCSFFIFVDMGVLAALTLKYKYVMSTY